MGAHHKHFFDGGYAASKAGMIGLTKAHAHELGRAGISANAVPPRFITGAVVSNQSFAAGKRLQGRELKVQGLSSGKVARKTLLVPWPDWLATRVGSSRGRSSVSMAADIFDGYEIALDRVLIKTYQMDHMVDRLESCAGWLHPCCQNLRGERNMVPPSALSTVDKRSGHQDRMEAGQGIYRQTFLNQRLSTDILRAAIPAIGDGFRRPPLSRSVNDG